MGFRKERDLNQPVPNKEYILKLILDKQAELQQRMLELNTEQKEYTTTTLLQDDHKKYELKTVKQFYQELIDAVYG